jgi:hypothetical protein
MQFLARLETNSLAWSDGDFGPGPRVAANARLARAHIEHPKAAQLYTVAGSESFLEALKYRVDRRFRFVAGQSGFRDDLMDDVLFYQCLSPPATMAGLVPIV